MCIIITLRFFDKCQIIPLAKTFSYENSQPTRQFRILEFPYQSAVWVRIFFPELWMCKNLIHAQRSRGFPDYHLPRGTWSTWTNISENNRNAILRVQQSWITQCWMACSVQSSIRLARALARWRPELIFDELKIITVTIIIKMIKRGEASRLGLV